MQGEQSNQGRDQDRVQSKGNAQAGRHVLGMKLHTGWGCNRTTTESQQSRPQRRGERIGVAQHPPAQQTRGEACDQTLTQRPKQRRKPGTAMSGTENIFTKSCPKQTDPSGTQRAGAGEAPRRRRHPGQGQTNIFPQAWPAAGGAPQEDSFPLDAVVERRGRWNSFFASFGGYLPPITWPLWQTLVAVPWGRCLLL